MDARWGHPRPTEAITEDPKTPLLPSARQCQRTRQVWNSRFLALEPAARTEDRVSAIPPDAVILSTTAMLKAVEAIAVAVFKSIAEGVSVVTLVAELVPVPGHPVAIYATILDLKPTASVRVGSPVTETQLVSVSVSDLPNIILAKPGGCYDAR